MYRTNTRNRHKTTNIVRECNQTARREMTRRRPTMFQTTGEGETRIQRMMESDAEREVELSKENNGDPKTMQSNVRYCKGHTTLTKRNLKNSVPVRTDSIGFNFSHDMQNIQIKIFTGRNIVFSN